MEKCDREVKEKNWISTKNRNGSHKEGTFALASVNVSGSVPDISGTKSVTANRSEDTVASNRSENAVMTRLNGHKRLRVQKRVYQGRPEFHSSPMLCSNLCFSILLRERVASCLLLVYSSWLVETKA